LDASLLTPLRRNDLGFPDQYVVFFPVDVDLVNQYHVKLGILCLPE
jgi:hypothetical protein